MEFKASSKKLLFLALGLYCLGLIVFVYFEHNHIQEDQQKQIDWQLRAGANSARAELLELSLIRESLPSNAFEAAGDEALSKIALNNSLDAVFCIKLTDGKIHITNSATAELVNSQDINEYQLYNSDEPNFELLSVFKNRKATFINHTGRNGDFRRYIQPLIEGPEVNRVIVADISIKKFQHDHQGVVTKLLLLGAFAFSLFALPVLFLLLRSIIKEQKAENLLFFTQAETGLKNFAKLQLDIKGKLETKLLLIEVENYNDLLNAIGPEQCSVIIQQLIDRIQSYINQNILPIETYQINDHKFALTSQMRLSKNLDRIINQIYHLLIKQSYGTKSDNQIHLGIRMGAATNNNSLFVLANMALDKAKKTNQSLIFYNGSQDRPTTYTDNLEQANIFRKAIKDERIKAFFQPIVDSKTAEISKFECLARVVDSDNQVMQYPEQFLPLVYGTRLSKLLTRLMLIQSLEVVEKYHVTISINLAVSDLFDESTMQFIEKKLQTNQYSHLIEFEILEHEEILDYEKASKLIIQLQQYGCKVGMDDLGKNYSNFDRLINLPLDFVKIDGSITPNSINDEAALILTNNIVQVARNRQLTIVAEYCTNERVTIQAIKSGIDYLQGYYISKPRAEIGNMLKDHNKIMPRLKELFDQHRYSKSYRSYKSH